MKFLVMGDSLESWEKDGKTFTTRRLLLLGEGDDLAEQLCEFNMPADSPSIGKGRVVDLKIKEISSIFGGKPRLRGSLRLFGAVDGNESEAEGDL